MKKVKILTDSCADLTETQLLRYDIDYVKMMTVRDGVERPASLTWSEGEAHETYEYMRGGRRITTAQVPMQEFERAFTTYAEAGFDIVYIGCSSKQSGSVNTGALVAEDTSARFPDTKIVCIDSLNASMGEGMLAIRAADLAAAGASAEEIEADILSVRKRVNQYVTVHSLDALCRAGRISGSTAFFGNLMGVKPILISDVNGAQTAYKKARGRRGSFREIVSLLKESIVSPEEQTLYLTHADCRREEVESLVQMICDEIPCRGVEVGYIGPIIGASIGPDAIGVWCFGQEVSFKAGE